MRPGVRDRGRDGAVVRAREHGIVLDARADHLVRVCRAKRGELRRARHERVRRVGLHVR